MGFKVRNITNILGQTNKSPLNLFFVDLEPAENNKQIFELKYLFNMKIAIEPPHKSTNIVQCTRCQTYGHTKAYCTHPFACVKCGGDHSTSSCSKSQDLPATCALCDGPHPANYKGCTVYKDLQNLRKNKPTAQQRQPNSNPNHATTTVLTTQTSHNNISAPHTSKNNQPCSYASLLYREQHPHNYQQPTLDEQPSLTSLIQEFKSMFQQLMNQNTMIIQMLQTVITNFLPK
ncbi:hypothetical protein M8J76_002814 [Diaphorina citri]|jgi:Arginine methyltransferase-interacting protein, contains RING Zn-finger|nr:hypothetical protein M8J76_002814 [Diaphorina citri]